jgi:hypothetical protein
MPDDSNLTPIQTAWRNVVNSVRSLLGPQPDERPLDKFLTFRDAVLAVVENDQFLADLDEEWASFTDFPKSDNGDALILELNAFQRSVEVAQATQKPEEQKQGWQKMLSRASTVSGSVQGLDTLPSYTKGALTLFGELLALFEA